MSRSGWLVWAVGALVAAACGSKGEVSGRGGDGLERVEMTDDELRSVGQRFALEGFSAVGAARVGGGVLRLEFKGRPDEAGVWLEVGVSVRGCDPDVCPPLDFAQWKAREESFKRGLPPVALEAPGLDVGVVDLRAHGVEAVGVRTRYMVVKDDGGGGTTTSASNRLVAHWHDGAHRLEVEVRGNDWGAADQAEMVARLPEARLVEAAVVSLKAGFGALGR